MTDLRDEYPPMLKPHPHVTSITGLSRNTVYRLIRAGEIEAKRCGARLLLVPRDKLLRQYGMLEDDVASLRAS
jgi:excisionase family DNA binding protein